MRHRRVRAEERGRTPLNTARQRGLRVGRRMTSWPGDDEHWSIGEPEKPAGDGTHEHPSNRPRARPADDDAPGAEHLCHPEQLVGRVSVAKEKGPRHTGSGQEEFDHHLAVPGDLLHSIVVVGRLDRTRLDSRLTLERLSAGELWPELAHFIWAALDGIAPERIKDRDTFGVADRLGLV
jgi:hypothetical protein